MDCQRVSAELQELSGQLLARETDRVERFKLQALKRGCAGIKAIGRSFKIMDNDGSRKLSLEEFKYGCRDWGISLSERELEDLFRAFDKDGSGTMDYEEFLAAIRPPMNEARRRLVKKAFDKINTTSPGYERARILQQQQQQQQQGVPGSASGRHPSAAAAVKDDFLTYEDLACVYKVEEHPQFRNGEMTKKQVLQQFLDNFQPGSKEKDDKVTLQEFMDYYSAISLSIDNDATFSFLILKSWGVNPVD